jgi:hypothetical protein
MGSTVEFELSLVDYWVSANCRAWSKDIQLMIFAIELINIELYFTTYQEVQSLAFAPSLEYFSPLLKVFDNQLIMHVLQNVLWNIWEIIYFLELSYLEFFPMIIVI